MSNVIALQDELAAALTALLSQREFFERCPRTELIGRVINQWLVSLEARQIAVETALGVLGSLQRHNYPALPNVDVTDSALDEIASRVRDARAAGAIFKHA